MRWRLYRRRSWSWRPQRRHWALVVALATLVRAATAESVLVAVATNFVPTLEMLTPAFESKTRHSVRSAAGATGQLYAQIVHGAPYDVLLAADEERPRRLAEAGLGLPDSRFTYAEGRLVLYGPAAPELMARGLDALTSPALRRLAIANPAVAPYGLAAQQTLEQLGLWTSLAPRLVRGENIGQAYTIVATGNAELGFVALSQVLTAPPAHVLLIPTTLYAPIRQDAILLARGAKNPAAQAFLAFLRSADGRALIERAGYGTP